MSDRNDRSSRLARRLGDEPDDPASDESTETEDAEPTAADEEAPAEAAGDAAEDEQSSVASSPSSKPSKSSKTAMPTETDDPATDSVKDRPSVLMYLPTELRQEMDIRFDEINAAAKRSRGEGIGKNRDWYPLLVSLALEKTDEMAADEVLARLDETEY